MVRIVKRIMPRNKLGLWIQRSEGGGRPDFEAGRCEENELCQGSRQRRLLAAGLYKGFKAGAIELLPIEGQL